MRKTRLLIVSLVFVLSALLPLLMIDKAQAQSSGCAGSFQNCITVNYQEDCSNKSTPPPQWTVTLQIYRGGGATYVYPMNHNIYTGGQWRYYQEINQNFQSGYYQVRLSTPNGWSSGWTYPQFYLNGNSWLGSFSQIRTC